MVSNAPVDPAVLLEGIRDETRFELQLLHERVNTLLAAEAFLTIAYTATMNSKGTWAAVVAPVLAVLGLLLAGLAWPGVRTTANLVMQWTYQVGDLIQRYPQARPAWSAITNSPPGFSAWNTARSMAARSTPIQPRS